MPRSRTNPHYDRHALPPALADFGISYRHVAELGGLRSPSREVAPDVNAYWENQSFHELRRLPHER